MEPIGLAEGTAAGMAAAVLDGCADPIVVVGANATLRWANRAAEQRFGWETGEFLGTDVSGLVHPDDLDTAILSLASVQAKDTGGTLVELRVRDASGAYAWFEVRGRPLPAGGEIEGVVLVLRETTDRRHWELGAGGSAALGTVLDVVPTITLVVDEVGRIRSANRALTRILGRPLDTTIGMHLRDLAVGQDPERIDGAIAAVRGDAGASQIEVALQGRSGPVPLSMTFIDLLADRAVEGIVVTATDITSLVVARADLQRLATHDDLTGLPNRAALRDHLDALEHRQVALSLLFGDVDGLKAVNDKHGHRAGDAFLREIAERLRAAVRADDFVARLSGDEFVVVLPTAASPAVEEVRARIDASLVDPVVLPSGHRVRASLSFGLASSHEAVDAEELLASADAAMYLAKRADEL